MMKRIITFILGWFLFGFIIVTLRENNHQRQNSKSIERGLNKEIPAWRKNVGTRPRTPQTGRTRSNP